ncbi:TadE/TadG family type IV pilus assembly protein [Rhizobium sp. CC-YZS058]|uniref:TadE/TadG family type IV pilus assembly protein n=1 Tax=Rhizobium sp. CC-YZS058 TaxID=3042153 RepID=UPI002B0577BD|nr:TadE/TadG family type IV pilus assembly protein [Rhizobium sp. CC-YZS058]MEA3533278.1 TadE/TadG family type IV pilus assembly protein [Rhizobium sp. CC-YZS058]
MMERTGIAFTRHWRRLRADTKGVAAIEFAMLAPILLMIYLGAFNLSIGFDLDRRTARAASTVADLLTQRDQTDKATLDSMKTVTESILAPFTVTNYTLKMTAIKVTAAGVGTVLWSRDQAGNKPYAKGAIVVVPTDLSTINSVLVHSELTVPYQLSLFTPMPSAANSVSIINLSKDYYFRQRVGDDIKCPDC